MRKKHPEAERPFRCPWVPVVPILGVLSCLLLMFSLPAANWWRLLAWLALGFVIYFAYGRRHSVMHAARMNETPAQEPPTRLPISEES
jgi:APA family basic amino acid/polyamine antiporter